MDGGFRDSPLRVNQGLGQLDRWNEGAIKHRAEIMAKQAVTVWAAPSLSQDILHSYQVSIPETTAYSIDDHPNLSGGPIRSLFDDFRREVKALDPCVSEQFLKLYVAYKAETNFADVVPQAKALRISLNLDPHELTDPREMVVDVTDVGRWGNGNAEVKLSDHADIPYVIGLVRQSLEKQLGASDET